MKPKPRAPEQDDLLRPRLTDMIDLRHELVKLAALIDWEFFEEEWAGFFPSHTGRPATSPRLVAGLLYLQHAYQLSDEAVVARWVENPYYQHLCGETFFQHRPPVDPSSLTRWRNRIGEEGVEWLLTKTIEAGREAGVISGRSAETVIVDTTVMEKAIAHPTDTRLYEKARRRLVKLAREAGLSLRQKPKDKRKLYALHEPEVDCISKGKARVRYEFGTKVSVATTHKEGFVVGMRAMPGNPYDGHTLYEALEQVEILTGTRTRRAFVDRGYRGHGVKATEVFISGQRRGMTPALRRDLRRRTAIEPVIGHMKTDGRLARCALKGTLGDALHAVLCGCGHNIRMILAHLRALVALILAALVAAIANFSEAVRPNYATTGAAA